MRPRTAHALRGPACTLCDVIKYGFFHQVRLLISIGINLECRDNSRRTPLILCAFMEPEAWGTSIAMTLIETGVCVAQRDCYGRNVLHYACIYERKNLVQVLLKAIDFDLNQADKMGNTALHYAAMSGNLPITQIVAQTYKKYRMDANKRNSQGKTAREEALQAGNSACAHAIQLELTGRRPGSAVKDVRFADDVIFGSTSDSLGWQTSSPLSKKRALRPMSAAFLTRRDSGSSINSTDERRSSFSFRSRSSISLHITGFTRKSQNPLYANGYKKDDEVIHCAPEGDFRNKPDYVFKLIHMPYDPEIWDPVPLMDSTYRSSSWADTCSTAQSQQTLNNSWRHEFKQLFKVYENQCSASWRATKPPEKPVEPPTPSSPKPEEEEKGRRGRRGSVVSRHSSHGHGKESSPELKRRASTARLRRIPSASSKGGGPTMDGSLDTSSESINSLASNKRRGQEKEQNPGRQDNVTARQRPKSPGEPTIPVTSPSSSPTPPSGARTSTLESSSHAKSNRSPQTDSKTPPSPPPTQNSISHQEATSGKSPETSSQGNVSLATSITKGNNGPSRADKSSSGAQNSRETTPTHQSHQRIPEVKTTLIADERRRSSAGFPQEVDPNMLSVQNPYDDDDDDDDEEDDYD